MGAGAVKGGGLIILELWLNGNHVVPDCGRPWFSGMTKSDLARMLQSPGCAASNSVALNGCGRYSRDDSNTAASGLDYHCPTAT
jgi:hypothetical protein